MTDNQKLNLIVGRLIDSKKIKNENDFCTKLGYPTGNFSKIKSGKRKVPDSIKLGLITHFGIDLNKASKDESVEEKGQKIENTNSDITRFLADTMQIMKEMLMKRDAVVEMAITALKDTTDRQGRLIDLGIKSGAIKWENKSQPIEENVKLLYNDAEAFKKSMKFLDRPAGELAICISDPAGKITFVNDEFTSQTGYTLDDMKGKKPGSVLQKGNTDQDGVRKIREAIKNKKYFEGEVVNYSKSGDEIICRLALTPIFDKSGKLEKFISVAVFSKVDELSFKIK